MKLRSLIRLSIAALMLVCLYSFAGNLTDAKAKQSAAISASVHTSVNSETGIMTGQSITYTASADTRDIRLNNIQPIVTPRFARAYSLHNKDEPVMLETGLINPTSRQRAFVVRE